MESGTHGYATRWQMFATPTRRRGSSAVLTAGIGTKESTGLPLPDADRLHATLVAVLRALGMNSIATEDIMITVDTRTRFVNDAVSLDPATFVDEHVPALPEERSVGAGRGAARLGLAPLTLSVDGEPLTFCVEGERLVVERGAHDALVVALDRSAFSDLVQDVASTFGVQMAGRAKVEHGSLDAFLEWEPVLRCLLDGRPVYEPGTIAFLDRAGAPLDLHRSFALDDDPSDVGHFLAEAGYLHLEGVFTEEEMAAVSAELDDAIAAAERDDGASWWARTSEGGWYPARHPRLQPAVADAARIDAQRPLPIDPVVHRR